MVRWCEDLGFGAVGPGQPSHIATSPPSLPAASALHPARSLCPTSCPPSSLASFSYSLASFSNSLASFSDSPATASGQERADVGPTCLLVRLPAVAVVPPRCPSPIPVCLSSHSPVRPSPLSLPGLWPVALPPVLAWPVPVLYWPGALPPVLAWPGLAWGPPPCPWSGLGPPSPLPAEPGNHAGSVAVDGLPA